MIHYDLAWNPAVIEQRTGRTDRIGSKTFRERALENDVYLEISVPFLAGTYDERMYEELRLRAQAFEVLTGGDMAAAIPDADNERDDVYRVMENSHIVSLPEAIVRDLKVNLHVWSASSKFAAV